MKTKTEAAPVRRRTSPQRTAETKLKIIKAAITVFGKLGFDGATTRGIAEAGRVPHSLVIYHFKTKSDLWRETVREAVQWYTQCAFGEYDRAKHDDPVAELKRSFAHYIHSTRSTRTSSA